MYSVWLTIFDEVAARVLLTELKELGHPALPEAASCLAISSLPRLPGGEEPETNFLAEYCKDKQIQA